MPITKLPFLVELGKNQIAQLITGSVSEFTHLVGFQRLPIPDQPEFEFGKAPIEEWKESEFLLSYVALITLSQYDVRDDYGYLLGRLDTIQKALVLEATLNQ